MWEILLEQTFFFYFKIPVFPFLRVNLSFSRIRKCLFPEQHNEKVWGNRPGFIDKRNSYLVKGDRFEGEKLLCCYRNGFLNKTVFLFVWFHICCYCSSIYYRANTQTWLHLKTGVLSSASSLVGDCTTVFQMVTDCSV